MSLLPALISGEAISSLGGEILVWQPGNLDINFEFKRVYFLHGLNPEVSRGHHAHKKLSQILLVTCGSFVIEAWDRNDTRFTFQLRAFGEGLFLPPGFWRVFHPESSSSTMAVFASHEYEESDYIRSMEDFYNWIPDD